MNGFEEPRGSVRPEYREGADGRRYMIAVDDRNNQQVVLDAFDSLRTAYMKLEREYAELDKHYRALWAAKNPPPYTNTDERLRGSDG